MLFQTVWSQSTACTDKKALSKVYVFNNSETHFKGSKQSSTVYPFENSKPVNYISFCSWMMKLQKKCTREFQGEGVGQQFSTLLLKHSPLFSVALQFIKQFIQIESIVYLRKLQQKRCCIFFMI